MNELKQLQDRCRHFNTFDEAHDWGCTHYQPLLDALSEITVRSPPSPLSLLYLYCGNMSLLYNRVLWSPSEFDIEERVVFESEIAQITQLIHQYQVPEDIVSYHCAHKLIPQALFGTPCPAKGALAINCGFMSTSLDRPSAMEFKWAHRKNAVLKLYIPKGTPGIFLEFKHSRLAENELLLPPGITLRYMGRSPFSVFGCQLWHCSVEKLATTTTNQ